jgi:hypothetical protein
MSNKSLPLLLPGVYRLQPGQVAQPDVDTGGYDFSIGGNGFRFATDAQQFPYSRVTEPTTVRRFDDSNEPGEQSLSPLPWIKSQNSFHGGAGQRNLERGYTAFQYEQEQVSHVRFDTSLGVDVWTPGVVKRLPRTTVTATGLSTTTFAAANSPLAPGSGDYVIAGGSDALSVVAWPSGPDNPGTYVDLTPLVHSYGGGAFTVESIATDGSSWFALVHFTSNLTNAAYAGVRTFILTAEYYDVTSGGTLLYKAANDSVQHHGVLGWAKARLVAGIDRKLYELDPGATAPSALPTTAVYTHPSQRWTWTAISESPGSVLGAGVSGAKPDILSFDLDTSGPVPVLGGGASVGQVPNGERIYSMVNVLGTFIALGTTKGIRVGTFDTYTGALKLGPLSVETTSPVRGVATRDRFVYGGFTDQQADGTTGLCRVDLSYIVDATGRNAWAPDLRPPSTATTGTGDVLDVDVLPASNRMFWYSDDGLHVEGDGPSADGVAWLKTSRIRYDTAEFKLFKSARIAGTLSDSSITVAAETPFGGGVNLGTFGFLVDGNPGEFGLPTEICEWVQMRFQLNGATCQLNSYQVKAYPSPKVQDVITLTANCFVNETDKSGLSVVDPRQPRERFEAVRQLKLDGQEVRYVEYTNQGAVALLVLIDQVAFQSFSRPSTETDFGGYVTLKLRVTQ